MMRPAIMAGAVALLGGVALLILAGGRTLGQHELPVPDAAPIEITAPPPPKIDPPRPSGPARKVAEEIVAPPELDPTELQRVEPRAALSRLGQALPPKPEMPDEWEGTVLYRPVAMAAGRVEAMGYKVVVSGIDIVDPAETCNFKGKSWDCGVRARTAFRYWLRGRAITCAVPPQPEREAVLAQCRIGKQDVGAWLVANGWARPTAGSAYAEAGEKAKTAGKGMFGAPPDKGGLPPPSTLVVQPMPSIDPTEPSE